VIMKGKWHLALGAEGEERALKYLEEKGYKILEKNWKRKFGEIDIVAGDPEGALVIVEVKTMRFSGGGFVPEDNMTREKMAKFKRAATAYANQHPSLILEKRGWRCDVLALTKVENNYIIKHYENVQ